jgi:hypothetical protein
MIDFNHPPLWYCILMMVLLASLIKIVISGLDRKTPMSRTSRVIRVAGGGIWSLMIIAGMAVLVVEALYR